MRKLDQGTAEGASQGQASSLYCTACTHVSGRGGSKLCRFCGQKARPPAPHLLGRYLRSLHDGLLWCGQYIRLLLAQYDGIYRATARVQDGPATSSDSEVSDTHTPELQVPTGQRQTRGYVLAVAPVVLFGATRLRLEVLKILEWTRGSTMGRAACEASGPRMCRAAHTDLLSVGLGSWSPGLSSANGRFVFIVVDPSRVKKRRPARHAPFFPSVWLAVTGSHSLKQQP